MNRIYHPWDLWECHKSGFFKNQSTKNKRKQLELCINLYSDSIRFKKVCNKIITKWVFSCEHNLSNEALNKIAWMGQACCAIEYGISSDISRSAFNEVKLKLQKKADIIAQNYVNKWGRLNGFEKI